MSTRSNRARPVALKPREQQPPTSWYRIENRADVSEVWLYDEIGQWGIGASDFVKDLRDIKSGSIDLHINSPGGEVYDGVAIFNALRNHKATVNVHVDGIAASSASFIAMAGDTVEIARNAQMMVHEAHAISVGNAKDMRDCASLLDKCSDNIADIYSQRAGGTVMDWRERMTAETWYSAEEAVKAGLADSVSGQARVSNTWDLSIFMYAGREKAPDPFLEFGREVAATTAPEPGPANYFDGVPEPPPPAEPEPADPPTEAGFLVPDFRDAVRSVHEIRFDLDTFRAAVAIGVGDVPAPDPPPVPQPAADEPIFTYLPAVRRALKEATL